MKTTTLFPTDESANKSSRFNELLGKKEKTGSKKEVPKSLDDFMAKISSKPEKEAPPKKGTLKWIFSLFEYLSWVFVTSALLMLLVWDFKP